MFDVSGCRRERGCQRLIRPSKWRRHWPLGTLYRRDLLFQISGQLFPLPTIRAEDAAIPHGVHMRRLPQEVPHVEDAAFVARVARVKRLVNIANEVNKKLQILGRILRWRGVTKRSGIGDYLGYDA
jgi:hypothetical protein